MLAHANEGFRDYALLPIPLLRQFRHKSIFVRADAGIETPEDLKGRRVGTPGYSSTSLTWIRGFMQHEYGVGPDQLQWVISAKESSAKDSGRNCSTRTPTAVISNATATPPTPRSTSGILGA